MAFKLGMTADLCTAYMLMLVSMTLTLMQGHSGLAEGGKSALIYLDNHASNKLAAKVGQWRTLMMEVVLTDFFGFDTTLAATFCTSHGGGASADNQEDPKKREFQYPSP